MHVLGVQNAEATTPPCPLQAWLWTWQHIGCYHVTSLVFVSRQTMARMALNAWRQAHLICHAHQQNDVPLLHISAAAGSRRRLQDQVLKHGPHLVLVSVGYVTVLRLVV